MLLAQGKNVLIMILLVAIGLSLVLGHAAEAVAIAVIALVAVSAFAAGELFAARASYLQVGAMLGTIMAANVFFVIIPAHRELIRLATVGQNDDLAMNTMDYAGLVQTDSADTEEAVTDSASAATAIDRLGAMRSLPW